MKQRWTEAERAWLAENYGKSDIHETTALLNARFGHSRTEQAVHVKAKQMGLHRPVECRDGKRVRRCERPVAWSRHPEYVDFMRENDNGSVAAIVAKFRERFGFTLTQTQVSTIRGRLGTQRHGDSGKAHSWSIRPIGYERDTGKGYVLVKVAEKPEVPGSKDNWKMKHVLAWERANGRELPDGYEVLFADRDHSNYDPGNLVAVEKAVVGIMNTKDFPTYYDRESLDACIALAKLQRGIVDASMRPRKCAICGREFTPRHRDHNAAFVRTCPDCVDAGHKACGKKRLTPEMEGFIRGFYPSHGIDATLEAWPFEWKPTKKTLCSWTSALGIKRVR